MSVERPICCDRPTFWNPRVWGSKINRL